MASERQAQRFGPKILCRANRSRRGAPPCREKEINLSRSNIYGTTRHRITGRNGCTSCLALKVRYGSTMPTKLDITRDTSSPVLHPLDKTTRLTWAALTLLKITYGTDTLLTTELRIRFQNQFPHADLGMWAPGADGRHADDSAMKLD